MGRSSLEILLFEIYKLLRDILNTNLPMRFSMSFFLGISNLQVRQSDKYLFGILITSGEKALIRLWLLPDPRTILEWTSLVNNIYLMEKITFSLWLQKGTFNFSETGYVGNL